MKKNVTISVDIDLWSKLPKNKSLIIECMIRDYFDKSGELIEDPKQQSPVVIKQIIIDHPRSEVTSIDSSVVTTLSEDDLENFLVNNLHLIDKDLVLYQNNGTSGRQFPTDIGDIDLLCKKNDDFVIIELKKGRSGDATVGQISRYMGWIKENLAGKHNVTGLIIVREFDPKLKYAVLANPNIELKYYQMNLSFLNDVCIDKDQSNTKHDKQIIKKIKQLKNNTSLVEHRQDVIGDPNLDDWFEMP